LNITGSNQSINYAPQSRATLVRNRIGSTKRASAEIGFDATIPLEDGLRRLVAWRRTHIDELAARRSRVPA
jgi:UDP-glucose 4-epimerase